MSLVDAIRGAESALTQANALLDAIDNAANNIRHATDSLAASIADTKSDIAQAEEFQKQGRLPSSEELTKAHDAAVAAVADAERIGATDPLTAFTHLAAADAQLDKLLAAAQEERAAAERRARVLDQALVAARQRLDAVNQYIGLHRGAVGARTRWNLTRHSAGWPLPSRAGPPIRPMRSSSPTVPPNWRPRPNTRHSRRCRALSGITATDTAGTAWPATWPAMSPAR